MVVLGGDNIDKSPYPLLHPPHTRQVLVAHNGLSIGFSWRGLSGETLQVLRFGGVSAGDNIDLPPSPFHPSPTLRKSW